MIRRSLLLGALLAVVLPLAALAAPDAAALARDDLALSRLLVRQEREMQAAGLALEEWAAGRLSAAEAMGRARGARERCRALEAEVGHRASTADSSLARSARRVARERGALVEATADLVGRGAASRGDLLAFSERQGAAAASSLEVWLGTRREVATRIGRLAGPAGVAAYYRWQGRLVPLQLQSVALGKRARVVLEGLAGGRRPDASGLFRLGQELSARVAALRVEPLLAAAQKAAVRESQSLSRLAEAVELMAADPSPESSSRVARWSASVRKDSARAEEESLEALARALQSR